MHETLILLAAGRASRMKNAPAGEGVAPEDAAQANSLHKGLIGVGEQGRPLMDYILYNAWKAGHRRAILVTGEDNRHFQSRYGAQRRGNRFHGLEISYAIQAIPPGREKPFGTADALCQALEQFPELQREAFSVCNSDNLYSEKAFRLLRETSSLHAWINYDRDALEFTPERLAGFAVAQTDRAGKLLAMIEKPEVLALEQYRGEDGKIRVSMNLFKFSGDVFYPYLRDCPVTPGRNEKELVSAIAHLVEDNPGSMRGIPLGEHVPDLTEKKDIARVRAYLQQHYARLDWED